MAEGIALTTEKIREISKIEELPNIHRLSLAKQGLSRISSEVFQQLTSLEELNLADNSLTYLDIQGIFMPSLTTLNLANNQLVTLEGFTAFPNLKDLNISNNPNIEVSEKYKLVAVCPLLKLLDGKDVSMMREAVSRLDATLISKVAELWKGSFEQRLRKLGGNEDAELKKDYLEKLKTEVTCGPPMLKMYREFRLSILGEQYFLKMSEKEKDESPRKKAKISVNGEIESTKLEDKGSKTDYPIIKDYGSNDTKRVKIVIQDCLMQLFKYVVVHACFYSQGKPYPADAQFVVSHLLQTHSLNNNPDDRTTQVWGCQFEPDVDRPGHSTSVCATCGGDSVCFIDCNTGQVMKKYKQPGETFYCIAWTTVTLDINGNKRSANLIAAGGAQKAIKIIEPTQLVCLEEVFGLKGVLESLLFHPVNKSWLLCAADDTITIWDIGLPTVPGFGKSKLLMTLKSRTIVRSFTVPPRGEVVIGACDDGCYLWRITDMDTATDKQRSPFGSLEFTGKRSIPLDCAQCLSDSLVATKRVQEGSICIWRSESNMLKNDFKLVLIVPWRKTETPFLKFSYIPTCEVLIAGDDEGCVWMYDMMRFTPHTDKKPSPQKHEVMEQTQILLCPNDSTKVFNQVCASTSLEYIVAVADTNVVCMWKRAKAGEQT